MNKKVLMIEDDRELCSELGLVLEDEGYRVTTVHDGEAGLQEIKNGDYALILLDLKMPVLSGIDVLQAAKRDFPDIPIIIITARMRIYTEEHKQEEQDAILGLADYIIKKPFKTRELLAIISSFF